MLQTKSPKMKLVEVRPFCCCNITFIYSHEPGIPSSTEESPLVGSLEQGISRGRGIGLFVIKAIARGELVLVEKPLLLASYTQTREKILKSVKRLPPHKMEQYTSLSYPRHSPRRPSQSTSDAYDDYLYSIWSINTFSCPLNKRGVYTTASRINHSCTPNLMFSHKSDNATMLAHTVRDIAAGEELTWSYIDVCQPSEARQDRLNRVCPDMGVCICDTCAEDTLVSVYRKHQSDMRRARMFDLRILLSTFRISDSNKNCEVMLRYGVELEKLLKAEGLEGMQLAACYHMMSAIRARKGPEMAVGYKKRELEVLETCFGVSNPRYSRCVSELGHLEAGRKDHAKSSTDACVRADDELGF